jgi:hypothetical protein
MCAFLEHRENGACVYVIREEHTSIEKASCVVHYHLPCPLEVGIALQDTPISGAGLQHTITETWRLGGSEDAIGVASCIVPHLVEGRRHEHISGHEVSVSGDGAGA